MALVNSEAKSNTLKCLASMMQYTKRNRVPFHLQTRLTFIFPLAILKIQEAMTVLDKLRGICFAFVDYFKDLFLPFLCVIMGIGMCLELGVCAYEHICFLNPEKCVWFLEARGRDGSKHPDLGDVSRIWVL